MIPSGRSLLGTRETLFSTARLFDFDLILNLSKRVSQIGGPRRGITVSMRYNLQLTTKRERLVIAILMQFLW